VLLLPAFRFLLCSFAFLGAIPINHKIYQQATQINPLCAKYKQVTNLQPHVIQSLQFQSLASKTEKHGH
jgi:hypothetical protein